MASRRVDGSCDASKLRCRVGDGSGAVLARHADGVQQGSGSVACAGWSLSVAPVTKAWQYGAAGGACAAALCHRSSLAPRRSARQRLGQLE